MPIINGYRRRTVAKQSIEKKKLKARVRAMLLRGVTNQEEIASYIGRTAPTVGTYIREINEEWAAVEIKNLSALRNKRIAQLENSARLALVSFLESRKDAEEITRQIIPRKCPQCKGLGMITETKWCPACKGDGEVTAEVVTRKTKGQAGDSSFLGRFNECIREICKIEGHYPATEHRHKGKIEEKLVVETKTTIDYENMPAEMLLRMKEMAEELKQFEQPPKLLDVESVPVEDGDNKTEGSG